MENTNGSDTESTQILGDWEFEDSRSNPEVDKEEAEIKGSDKQRGVTGKGREEAARRRVLPPWVDPSYEWGGGKWKEDGRKSKKKKDSDEIPFKEVIEALLRNSGEKKNVEENGQKGCVEMLKAMGLKFPQL